MIDNELKPCPFCGCEDMVICDKGTDWSIYCWDCGAVGPIRKSRSDVISTWNHRIKETQDCKNCEWHDDFSGACCNGLSENRADFTDDESWCGQWENNNDKSEDNNNG